MDEQAAALRLLGSRHLLQASFLEVERNHYVGVDGTHIARVVVRHPGAVVVVPVIGQDVVLIRQHRVAVAKDLLELPAGKLEGDVPEEAARRECAEEIGYLPRSLTLLHTFYSTPGFSDERMWVYLAERLERVEKRPQGAEEEAAEIVRMPLSDALSAIDRGDIEDAKSLVGLLSVARRKKQ